MALPSRQLASALLIAIILCLISSCMINFILAEIIMQQRMVKNYQVIWQTTVQKQEDNIYN